MDARLFEPVAGRIQPGRIRMLHRTHGTKANDKPKFRDRPFQVWTTEGNQVVLPPRLVEETKMLPDDVFPSALSDVCFLPTQV